VLDFFRFIKPIPKNKREIYKSLIDILGFCPKDIGLYKMAFTHKSASCRNTKGHYINNERLEFLGDSILNSIIADYLFHKYPNKDEGFLTKMRSRIVNRDFLDELAINIKLNKLVISHIYQTNNQSKHIYGNALEALIGAIYIDRNFNYAKQFIVIQLLNKKIDLLKIEQTETNFKSQLIEWGQKYKKEISFETIEEVIDINSSPTFISYIEVDNVIMGKGHGYSKKEAEQNAAEKAIEKTLLLLKNGKKT